LTQREEEEGFQNLPWEMAAADGPGRSVVVVVVAAAAAASFAA
jgi:hypothetical protein